MPWGLSRESGKTRRSDTQNNSNARKSYIPLEIQDAVPVCAQPCLSNYIRLQWNSACSTGDCICHRPSNTTEQYSLGELALVCTKGPDCSGTNLTTQDAAIAYNLCSGFVMPYVGTYTALTVPAAAPTTTSSTRTTASTSSATVTSGPAIGTASTSSSQSHHPSASATAEPLGSVTPEHRPSLTSAQAVGVAIGSVSAVIIIVAVGYLLACVRRRRKQRKHEEKHGYDFADEEPVDYSPFMHASRTMRASPDLYHGTTTTVSSEKHHTAWPTPHYPVHQYPPAREHDHAYARDQGGLPDSPRSNTSMRTVSQLLPDRPGSQPPPPPAKSPRHVQVIRTPATVFEEERTPRLSNVVFQGLPAHPAVMKKMQTRPIQDTSSPPALSIRIPQQPIRTPESQSTSNWPLPPPPTLQAHQEDYYVGGHLGGCSSKNSLLDYYASADSGASPQDLNSSTPIEEAVQVRRPAPAALVITQPSYQPCAVRDSIASDQSRRTSFESTNPDETTPPEEEDKRLSPVVESPISNVRYPRIPRSSNQAIPRSPVYSGGPSRSPLRDESRVANARAPGQKPKGHAPTWSGSSLAAKRRGDIAAHELEQSLHINNSSHHNLAKTRENSSSSHANDRNAREKQQSPLRGYGRPAAPPSAPPKQPLALNLKSPQESLTSPLWEPKLTPSRKGDDLFLSVSVATPQASYFHGIYDRR